MLWVPHGIGCVLLIWFSVAASFRHQLDHITLLGCETGNETECIKFAVSSGHHAARVVTAIADQAVKHVSVSNTSLVSTRSRESRLAHAMTKETMMLCSVLVSVFLSACVFAGMLFWCVSKDSPRSTSSAPCALDEVTFTDVVSKDSEPRQLAWCSHGNAMMIIPPIPDPPSIELVVAPWSDAIVTEVLDAQGISAATWTSEAKKHLAHELQAGKARLFRHDCSTVRVVELVLVAIEYPADSLVLQEVSRSEAMLFDILPERTPTTRRRSDESVFDAARRVLNEKVGFPSNLVQVSEHVLSMRDVEESVRLYPGLQCVARKFLVRATIAEVEPCNPDKIGIISGTHQACDGTYEWVPRQRLSWLPKSRRASRSGSYSLEAGREATSSKCAPALEALSNPVLPWTEKTVSDTLERYSVESSIKHFGVSLQALVTMLNKGEFVFGFGKADARLICIMDRVCLGITAADGKVIVQKSLEGPATGIEKYSLPFTVRQPNENVWCAARRIAHAYFGHADAAERVCVQELAPEQAVPRGMLKASPSSQISANMMHRVFVVGAMASVASFNFDPPF